MEVPAVSLKSDLMVIDRIDQRLQSQRIKCMLYNCLKWYKWVLTLRYTTPDIHCRHRRHECDGGINFDISSEHYDFSVIKNIR